MKNISKSRLWTGRIMSGFVVLFLLFDATVKCLRTEEVIDTTVNQLGWGEHHIIVHAFLVLIPTILYVVPVTSVLGAVLLTAHFGGAIATHLRVDWGGIWLRDERLNKVFPFKS